MTTASFNYTGRKRINRKHFQVSRELYDDEAGAVQINIWIEQKLLGSIEDKEILVLDVMARGHERFELLNTESHTVYPDFLDKDVTARYRISVVEASGENLGRIRTSSDEFRLAPLPEEAGKTIQVELVSQRQEQKETFFNPIESDNIGSQLWKVDFKDCADFEILINRRLLEFHDGDKHDPVLRAHLLPSIVRDVFSGLFMRNPDLDSLLDTDAENWFKWATYLMNESCPKSGFIQDGTTSDEWLSWLDELIEQFTALKFVGAKYSLLEAMEEHQNA